MRRRLFLQALGSALVAASTFLPRFGSDVEAIVLDEERTKRVITLSKELLADSEVNLADLLSGAFAAEYAHVMDRRLH